MALIEANGHDNTEGLGSSLSVMSYKQASPESSLTVTIAHGAWFSGGIANHLPIVLPRGGVHIGDGTYQCSTIGVSTVQRFWAKFEIGSIINGIINNIMIMLIHSRFMTQFKQLPGSTHISGCLITIQWQQLLICRFYFLPLFAPSQMANVHNGLEGCVGMPHPPNLILSRGVKGPRQGAYSRAGWRPWLLDGTVFMLFELL